MKSKLLQLIILLVTMRLSVYAQCTHAVPSNVIVVSTTQTINGGFDPIWVCSNDTLHSDGGFHTTFLETGSVMTTSGGIDTIYVKKDASFFMSGGIHVIYCVHYSDLHISGGIPTVDSCAAFNFNYSSAPENGCIVTAIQNETPNDNSVLVYPNPASGEIHFDQSESATTGSEIKIYDAFGKLIPIKAIAQQKNTLSIDRLADGIYFYILSHSNGASERGKFIVQNE